MATASSASALRWAAVSRAWRTLSSTGADTATVDPQPSDFAKCPCGCGALLERTVAETYARSLYGRK
jgi:hypothetical protein